MPYTVADLVWGVEQAFAARPDDLLARRTRLSWESPAEADALRGLCEEILAGRYRGGRRNLPAGAASYKPKGRKA